MCIVGGNFPQKPCILRVLKTRILENMYIAANCMKKNMYLCVWCFLILRERYILRRYYGLTKNVKTKNVNVNVN